MSFQGDVMTVSPAAPRFRFNAPSITLERPRFPQPSSSSGSGIPSSGLGVTLIDPSQPSSSGQRADFQPYYLRPAYRFKPLVTSDPEGGPGRRLRKNLSNVRRHVDYVSNVLCSVESRIWQRNERDGPMIQPDLLYATEILPPGGMKEKPIDCVLTKFVRAAQNKVKCPIYDICWTPEGRRLITGASTGEFTLWNGTAFNFETILQAHDTAIRALEWSHNGQWLISADQDGFVKYWQANMNNVHMYQAHKESVRCVSFAPTDVKIATASDDGTVRVWDFIRCAEERILRGHGSDVRCVDWHPTKGLLVSGSRDTQQPVKIWDPKSGQCLATLHDHKNSVMSVQWNKNGNWLISGSRDHLIKLYDIRMMREVRAFRGHKKEVTSLAWHPVHEALFVSGGGDGSLAYWLVTNEKEVGLIEHAHDQAIWTLEWHPLGHILASGSNDNNTKFWTRNKPGDTLEDFHNMAGGVGQMVNMQTGQVTQTASQRAATGTAKEEEKRIAEEGTEQKKNPSGMIPGMGLEEGMIEQMIHGPRRTLIPGLAGPTLLPDDPNAVSHVGAKRTLIKQPPPKKAQRQFERMWNVSKPMGPSGGSSDTEEMDEDMGQQPERPRKSLLGLPPPSQPEPKEPDHNKQKINPGEQSMVSRPPPPNMSLPPPWRPRFGAPPLLPPQQQNLPGLTAQQALMASAQQQAAAAILSQQLGPMFQINQQPKIAPAQPVTLVAPDVDLRHPGSSFAAGAQAPASSGDVDFRSGAPPGIWQTDEDLRKQNSRDPRTRNQQAPAPELRDPRKRAMAQNTAENGAEERGHVNPKRKWQQEYEAEEQSFEFEPRAGRGAPRGRGRGRGRPPRR